MAEPALPQHCLYRTATGIRIALGMFSPPVFSPLRPVARFFDLCYTEVEATKGPREASQHCARLPRGGVTNEILQAKVWRMSIRFQWDPQKAARNATKHGVTFEEAAAVFQDPLALIFDDEEHSVDEHREIIIGHSKQARLVLVAFTEREDVIRVISARKADRQEREDYENAGR